MREPSTRLSDTGLLILRAVVGLIFLTHGWPKLMNGASGTADFFGQVGIPAPGFSAWLITLLEVAGGIALIIGLFVSLLSLLFIIHMTVGIFVVHLANGWYVVGPGQGGVEFNLLLIASLLTLILAGSGRPSVDAVLAARKARVSTGGDAGPPPSNPA